MISLTCGIKKKIIQMNLQNRNRVIDIENKLMVTRGEYGKKSKRDKFGDGD